MNLFKCRMCGEKISKWDYENKLYCSNKCRQVAYRIRKHKTNEETAEKSQESVTNRLDVLKNYCEKIGLIINTNDIQKMYNCDLKKANIIIKSFIDDKLLNKTYLDGQLLINHKELTERFS